MSPDKDYQMPLSALPDDVVREIFRQLGNDEELTLAAALQLRAVSTDWRARIATSEALPGQRLAGNGRWLKTCADVESATVLSSVWPWRARGLEVVLALASGGGPAIHTLDLEKSEELGAAGPTMQAIALAVVARTAPALHTLKLSGCDGLSSVDALAAAPAQHQR